MAKMKRLHGDDAAREQEPRDPTKKELAEMDDLRSQMEQEINERRRARC